MLGGQWDLRFRFGGDIFFTTDYFIKIKKKENKLIVYLFNETKSKKKEDKKF